VIVDTYKSKIVRLNILSYAGFPHYYGRLTARGYERDSIDTYRTLDDLGARRLNNLERGRKYHWKVGDTTSRHDSEEDVIASALAIWQKYFPGAEILMLGESSTVGPQRIISGPDDLISLANDYIVKLDALGWWDDRRNRRATNELITEWERIMLSRGYDMAKV
jgi:hypothetical protein